MSAPESTAPKDWLPRLVIAPSFVVSLLFIYGLMAWNGYLSLSASRLLPNYEFVGVQHYVTLLDSDRFQVAMRNMAVFGSLFIGGAMVLGVLRNLTLIDAWIDHHFGRIKAPKSVNGAACPRP